MENKEKYRGPSGMFLMFLILMTLKLTNFIDWSWWWVTAPLWAPIILVLLVCVLGLVIYAVYKIIKELKK